MTNVDCSVCGLGPLDQWESERGMCNECCCEDCEKQLITEEEKGEGVCSACSEAFGKKIQREEIEAYEKGLCHECYPEKEVPATTQFFISGGFMPVCQDCFDSNNVVEAVHAEFVIENERDPSIGEFMDAVGEFDDDV